jgi:hypothetical protein
MQRWMAIGAALMAMAVSGCDACRATPEKLSTLQRGMSYEEASRIMGCSGTPVARDDQSADDVSTIAWGGPGSIFMQTQIDFRDDRLLYYTTRARGGL